ncbi:MAG: hypothetical protein IKU10_07735, partial [Clostridia bacterium]|nr:hypothetical protein [Clostridia bacterium]
MQLLILTKHTTDLTDVLQYSACQITQMTVEEAVDINLDPFDAFCVLGFGKVLDARLRLALEQQARKGKKMFLEAVNSFFGIYSEDAVPTVRSRLVCVNDDINGLTTGDILDDEANRMMQPYALPQDYVPLLVYKEHIIAHAHLSATKEGILNQSKCGLWLLGENVMMSSFRLSDYNKARFAPRNAWQQVIKHVASFLTESQPAWLPEPCVTFGVEDLTDDATFELHRKHAVKKGIQWLEQFLVDDGKGGVLEGLRHNIDPDGNQTKANAVRSDCCGETATVFKCYAQLFHAPAYRTAGENLDSFIFGPLQVHGGLFDGMLRWTTQAWQVCYQDDVARAIFSVLFDCLLFGNKRYFSDSCKALDFLVKTTAQNGCRVFRTDLPGLTEEGMQALADAESGLVSAHYNAYYHAALLLAYQIGGDSTYLQVAKTGLETIMRAYPNTAREQSETQELCRLVFPLAVLFGVTGDPLHKEMLYRVVRDLQPHKHPSGGYREWDTGYTAACSRESTGECSLLTHNGDPIADLLYSVNWLPVGFAYAYHVTGDRWFLELWREVV